MSLRHQVAGNMLSTAFKVDHKKKAKKKAPAKTAAKTSGGESTSDAGKVAKQPPPTKGKRTRGKRQVVRRKRKVARRPGGRISTAGTRSTSAVLKAQNAQQTQETQHQTQQQRGPQGNELGKHMARRTLSSSATLTQASVLHQNSSGPQKPPTAAAQRNKLLGVLSRYTDNEYMQVRSNENDSSPYKLKDLRNVKFALASLQSGVAKDAKKKEERETTSTTASADRGLSEEAYGRKKETMMEVLAVFTPPENIPEGYERLELVG